MRQGDVDATAPRLGIFCLTGSPAVVELAGRLGFDFVIIDCEHGEISPYGPELVGLVRACVAGGASPMVRVTTNDPGQILKASDAGAEAVVVPQIRTADEALSMVEAGRYAPGGRRSACPSVRAAGYGTVGWPTAYRAEPRLFPLIEDAQALSTVEQIAAVPGLGGLFLGPFDLAVSQGSVDGVLADASDVRRRVYGAATAFGLPVADLAWDAAAAGTLADAGADLIALGTDVSLLVSGARDLLAAARRAPAVPSANHRPL